MAELRFRVKADYEELGKLRTEIQRLKEDLRKTGANTDTSAVKAIEAQLATLTKQYEAMTRKIAEAEAQYDMLAKKMTEKAKEIARAQDQLTAGPQANVTPQLGTDAPAVDQSIEAQAKAYEELKNEIDAIAGSKTNLIKQMLDEQNAIRLINAELKQINAQQKESGTQTQAQKERVTQLNASLLNHKEALSEVRQSLSNYVKLENAASGSMNELSQSLGRMRMVYRTLSEEERNSPFGQELLASIQQADAKIKELDATIGNHQRNVGNYGQAWNGLGNSIQQLARELPALANGPRVFFSAISNNLPILADEIKRARTEYDEMVKKGEKGTPVWKQIGASIFSWQTALTVGITLLTMYGDEIVEWGKKMIKGGKSALTAKDAVKELNKAMVEGSKEAGKSIAQLKVMEAVARDVAKADKERNIAATKVLETMGMAVTATNILKVKTGELTDQINLSTEALIRRAQAQGAMTKIDEQTSKVLEAQAKLQARQAEGIKLKDRLQAIMYSLSLDFGPGFFSAEDVFSGAVGALEEALATAKGDLETLVKEFNERFVSGLFGTETEAEIANRLTATTKEVERITQAETDAMRDRARAVKDMQLSVEQARIDGMAEGYDKMKAQRELNLRKELEQLNRQKEDYIRQVVEQEKAIFDAREEQKAKADKNYKIQIFDMESAMAEVAKTDPVVAQYAQAMAYTRRQFAVEAAKQDKQWAKQNAQMARELEQMTEEARIDAMKEGYAKQRAQRDYEHRQEIEALEREKQEYVEKMVERERSAFEARENENAKNIKGYKRKEFDAGATAAKVDTKAFDDTMAYIQQRYTEQEDEILKGLYEQYMSYEDSKKELEKQYLNDILELNTEYILTGDEKYARSIEERHKAYVKAKNDLEQLYDDSYKIVFRDPSKVSKKGLIEALDLAEKKLQTLITTGADAEQIEPLYEQIKAIREELDSIDISGITTDMMALIRQVENLRRIRKEKDGLEVGSELYNKALEAEKRAEGDLRKSLAATGASEFANALMQAADAMHQIAEESGDVELAELANSLSTAGNIFNSAIQGMLQAGPWGMLVGLITSAVGAIVNLAVEAEAADAKLASGLADFRRELQLTQLEIDSLDFEGIFGTQQFDMNADAIKKAQEAISLFKSEMEGLKHLTWKYGTGINWFPEEGVLFETYDKIDGLRNEDVWDEDGLLDVEKAKAYLETSTTITDEARKQVEHAIELREAYDAAQKVLDDFLSDFIGSTADDLTDAIFEGIDNGSDAWDIFEEKGSETIRNLGKQMLKELIIKDLSSMWTDRLREAAGDPTALADTYAEMMEWLKKQTAAYQNAAASWEEQYGGLYQASEDESQQTASRKGYETLSEDTGNELVGRATAQYESNLRMEESMSEMRKTMDLMSSNYITVKNIAEESRAIIADSYLELQLIRENTGAIIKPIKEMNDKMDRIISSM